MIILEAEEEEAEEEEQEDSLQSLGFMVLMFFCSNATVSFLMQFSISCS